MNSRGLLLLCLVTPAAHALQALTDADLSQVAGRDGISAEFRSSGISADQISWITDDAGLNDGSCSGGTANQHACTLISDLQVEAVSGDYLGSIELDAAAQSGTPLLRLAADWGQAGQPLRARIGGLTFDTPTWDASANSLGAFSMESTGTMTLVNQGLFNTTPGSAQLDYQSENDLIYRQGPAGSAELSFANWSFDMTFTDGAASGHNPGYGQVGIDSDGFFISAPNILVDYTFDLAFKASPVDFDTTGRNELMHFGWQGGLVNATQRIGSGGFGYGSYLNGPNTFQDYDGSQTGSRSEGINLLSEWDFDSDFALVIGEASGNGTFARFTNWQTLGGTAGPQFSFPLIFDVVQAGNAPAGLCAGPFTSGVASQTSCAAAGGEFFASGLDAGESAFAVLLRDAHLHAYSTQVQVEDPLAGGTVTPVNWGVLFTYGKMDADIFLRPQGRADGAAFATTNTGLRADITLVAQSPDAWRRANSSDAAVRATAGDGWRTNTHVMTVDTATPFGSGQNGVGFVNGDLIYQARDLFLRVTDGDSAYPDLPGGLWLHTDNFAQYRFRGIFGGGDLSDLSYDALTKVSLLDVNLQTSKFLFVLNPLPVDGATGAAPIGFNGLLDFDGGAYITVGEVSSPSSQFYVRDVSGRIAWRDGSLSLVSGENTASGLPRLVIENDLDIGASAGFGSATPGDPLVGTLGFGTEDFGRVAIPEGTWGSEIILEIPN